jgi:lipoprotein-anchoring transpeptidase ErfK/SrfK
MRTSPLALANMALIVVVSGVTLGAVGSGRQTEFKAQATQLEQRWAEMSEEGVSTKALQPVETALKTSSYQVPWWSPAWLNDPGTSFVQGLERQTETTWNQALAAARAHATAALLGWDGMVEHNAATLTAATVTASRTWVTRIDAASTPAAIDTISAQLALATAAAGHDALMAASWDVAALPTSLHTLLMASDQAGAENIAGATGYLSTYQRISKAVAAKPGDTALVSLSAQVATLNTTVSAALHKNACGHEAPSGKAIVINLTFQEAVFYENGCAVQATAVTSGRRNERTPTGTFHVFHKDSPVLFTSWAPRGSPFWYPPERANYALEFTVVRAGIFLHDAPWEPASGYGPGSQNTDNASHGCVHAPTSVMRWAFSWAPLGTPVIVVA